MHEQRFFLRDSCRWLLRFHSIGRFQLVLSKNIAARRISLPPACPGTTCRIWETYIIWIAFAPDMFLDLASIGVVDYHAIVRSNCHKYKTSSWKARSWLEHPRISTTQKNTQLCKAFLLPITSPRVGLLLGASTGAGTQLLPLPARLGLWQGPLERQDSQGLRRVNEC